MISKITIASDARKVLGYLVGRGHSNEHTDPKIVAGSDSHAILLGQVESASFELSTKDINAMTKWFEHDSDLHGTVINGWTDVKNEDGTRGKKYGDAHIFHCSLSLAAEEGELDDATWGKIAQDYMDAMEFTNASGKGECRWVAIHHGKSVAGNDHIHIVANRTRPNGTKWDPWQYKKRSSRAVAMIEDKYGLQVVEGRRHGRSIVPDDRNGLEEAKRKGWDRTGRAVIENRLRAALAASSNEAEWVRIVRQSGLAIRPRWDKGGQDKVVGYSVGIYEDGKVSRWYGGGRIARDLSLSRLRDLWEGDPADAVEAWRGGKHRVLALKGTDWANLYEDITDAIAKIEQIQPGDTVSLANAARDVAGLYAVTARRLNQNRGRLINASNRISHMAQIKYPHGGKRFVRPRVGRGIMMNGFQAGWIASSIVRAVFGVGRAVAAAHRRSGQYQAAAQIEAAELAARKAQLDKDILEWWNSPLGTPLPESFEYGRRVGAPTLPGVDQMQPQFQQRPVSSPAPLTNPFAPPPERRTR